MEGESAIRYPPAGGAERKKQREKQKVINFIS